MTKHHDEQVEATEEQTRCFRKWDEPKWSDFAIGVDGRPLMLLDLKTAHMMCRSFQESSVVQNNVPVIFGGLTIKSIQQVMKQADTNGGAAS